MAKIWTVPDFVSMVCNVHTDGNYFCDVRGFVGLEYVSSIFSMGVTSGLRNVFGEPVSTTGITQCASKILSLYTGHVRTRQPAHTETVKQFEHPWIHLTRNRTAAAPGWLNLQDARTSWNISSWSSPIDSDASLMLSLVQTFSLTDWCEKHFDDS